MLLGDIRPDTATADHPTRPTSKNNVGQQKTVAAVGLSDTSGMSDKKTDNVYQSRRSIRLDPLPMDWTPDRLDGLPICYLPNTPERLRGILSADLRGFGIPAQGLPMSLRPFSIGGWKLQLDGEDVRMVQAHPQARMEQGCKDYLRANKELVLTSLRQWEGMTCA